MIRKANDPKDFIRCNRTKDGQMLRSPFWVTSG